MNLKKLLYFYIFISPESLFFPVPFHFPLSPPHSTLPQMKRRLEYYIKKKEELADKVFQAEQEYKKFKGDNELIKTVHKLVNCLDEGKETFILFDARFFMPIVNVISSSSSHPDPVAKFVRKKLDKHKVILLRGNVSIIHYAGNLTRDDVRYKAYLETMQPDDIQFKGVDKDDCPTYEDDDYPHTFYGLDADDCFHDHYDGDPLFITPITKVTGREPVVDGDQHSLNVHVEEVSKYYILFFYPGKQTKGHIVGRYRS